MAESEYTPTTEESLANEIATVRHGQSVTASDLANRLMPWLAAHDAEVRAEVETDPAKDERVVRYPAMATPLGYQSALSVVQQMTLMIQAETEARRASVVAEEPEAEWEYAFAGSCDGEDWVTDLTFESVAEAESFQKAGRSWIAKQGGSLHRRRKAGPWLPVEQGGITNG